MDQQQKQTAAPAAATLRQYACVGAANSPLPSACPLQALAWRTAVCKPTVSLVDCRPYIGCVLVDPEPQSCTCCTAIEGLWSSIECSHGSESKMLHTIARALMKRDISYTATLKSQSARCVHSWNRSVQAQTSDQTIRTTDYIHLKGLTFHGYHGVLPEENLLGQKFVVDATLFVDLLKAGQTDNVHDTVNYADVYRHIKTVVEGRPHKLLESVAEQVSNEILNDYRQVQGMQLHIKKPHVAVSGVVESLGIEITRYRTQS